MKPPIRMADIAKAAGVHQGTVSRALRNDSRLSEATRSRIRSLAHELGYRPNPLVSALVASRRRKLPSGYGSTIAFLTTGPSPDSWRSQSVQYTALYDAIVKHAKARGYSMEEVHLDDPGVPPSRLKQILLYRGIRGLVVCPLLFGSHSLDFDFSEFAAIAIGLTLQTPLLDHVAIDYSTSTRDIIARLHANGFRRIGFLSPGHISDRVRHLSLGAFLAERQRLPRHLLAPPSLSDTLEKDVVLRWIQAKRPDVIITPTQGTSNQLQGWLQEIGHKIPGDHSLVCGDCHLGSNTSGIQRNIDAEASTLVGSLARRVEEGLFGVPEPARTIFISGRWRDGSTV